MTIGKPERGFSDTESQETMIRTDEEMGTVVAGNRDIRVEKVFVSSHLGFLSTMSKHHQNLHCFQTRNI